MDGQTLAQAIFEVPAYRLSVPSGPYERIRDEAVGRGIPEYHKARQRIDRMRRRWWHVEALLPGWDMVDIRVPSRKDIHLVVRDVLLRGARDVSIGRKPESPTVDIAAAAQ